MSIIALLHNLLKEKLPSIHATRLRALMAAVEAGLKGASVSITQLGRAGAFRTCLHQAQNQTHGSLTTAKNGSMDQCVCTQQNDKSGHACVRKNLTNIRNGELWPTFDLFNNAKYSMKTGQFICPQHSFCY